MNVLTGATRTLPSGRGAMIVQLQGHADHLMALLVQQTGHDAAVDPAGHGDQDAHQPLNMLLTPAGNFTTSPSSASLMMIWQPSREVSVRPNARSSMSSSSSVAVFTFLYQPGSTITWHVEHASEPSQAPSISTLCLWAISSTDRPAGD